MSDSIRVIFHFASDKEHELSVTCILSRLLQQIAPDRTVWPRHRMQHSSFISQSRAFSEHHASKKEEPDQGTSKAVLNASILLSQEGSPRSLQTKQTPIKGDKECGLRPKRNQHPFIQRATNRRNTEHHQNRCGQLSENWQQGDPQEHQSQSTTGTELHCSPRRAQIPHRIRSTNEWIRALLDRCDN